MRAKVENKLDRKEAARKFFQFVPTQIDAGGFVSCAERSQTDRNPPVSVRKNVFTIVRVPVRRHGHRPRHGQHPGLRQGARHRPERTLGRRHRRCQGPQAGARRRRGGEDDAGPHARQHPGHPAAARRRHRRLRGGRGDDQVLHPQGAQPAKLRQPAVRRLRPVRLDGGRAPRDPGIGRERRRPSCLPDRGADGRGHRRRPAGHRADGIDGRRHRRRHHRGRGAVAGRHRLRPQRSRRRRQDGRGDHRLYPPQP